MTNPNDSAFTHDLINMTREEIELFKEKCFPSLFADIRSNDTLEPGTREFILQAPAIINQLLSECDEKDKRIAELEEKSAEMSVAEQLAYSRRDRALQEIRDLKDELNEARRGDTYGDGTY